LKTYQTVKKSAFTRMTETTPCFEITTIGETMLRLSVPAGVRLEITSHLDVRLGGAESNVAALLARLGRRAAWCGALPATALGRLAANHLRMAGVNLDGVYWCDGARMGLYFVEFATPPRPTQVIYDRAASCAAQLTPTEVAWDHLLDTRLLHLTGITPALSASSHAIVTAALAKARAAGVAVSFDVNYRAKLWPAAQAATVLAPLLTGVDVLFCSRGDAERLFDLRGVPEEAVVHLARRTGAALTVMSVGADGVLAWDGVTLHRQPAIPTVIIDRPGAGDALAAGMLHGWLAGDVAQGLRYGVALAALALSQHGDMVVTTPAELEQLLGGSGAILR
jgi:2-dehydro-3-deoxygluconokinase